MSMLRALAAAALAVLLCVPALDAQQPAPAAAPAVAQPAQPPAEQPAPAAYTYSRDGRRDPFVSLIGRGADTTTGDRPAGLPGMLINEVNLKGIVKQSDGYVAMIQGTDKKTYVVRTGQRLLDGSVKSITHDAVIFAQDVNDPLSLVKQREVRKTLRAGEEGRG